MRDRDRICFESESRSRVFLGICAAACFALLLGCSGKSDRDLVQEFASELEIKGTAAKPLSRTLPAGVYLLEVREHEIDLRVIVDAQSFHFELVDQGPRHGVFYQVVRLATAAELRMQIISADHPTKRGKAELRIARWKYSVDAPPSELELGFSAFGIAGEQATLATPASWAKAAEKLYEAIAHFDRAGDEGARAQAAYTLANIQFAARDELSAAVRATEIASDAYDQVGEEIGLQNSATLRAAAEIELAAGMDADRQRAEQSALYASIDRRLAEAVAFYESNRLPLRAEYAVNQRALRAVNIGDYAAAEKLFSRALEMSRANRDIPSEARTLANLGAIHVYQGQIVQAAREYEALAPMIDRQSKPYQYAAWLTNYGFTMIALGDFDRALQLHLEALDFYTRIGKGMERANELTALGSLYLRMGDAARALETLRLAVAAQQGVADTMGIASTLRLAGNAAAALDDHEAALAYLRESARIDANAHGVARTRVLIAGQLRALGKYQAAELELAAPLQSTSALVRANALEERARLRTAQGKRGAIVEDLRTADRLYAELGMDLDRIDTNTELSRVLLAEGDLAGAGDAADEAVSIVSGVRIKSGNPEWRARFLSSRYAPFEARIAVELARAHRGDAAAAWRAFQAAEVVRARSLADELNFETKSAGTTASDEDVALHARLTSQHLRLESRIQRQDADEAGTLALRREIAETRAQIDSNRLRQGGVAASDHSPTKSLEQVRKALPADTAVLAYFVGDTRSYAWLLTRDQLRHATLESRTSLVAAIARMRRNQNNASNEWSPGLARKLLGDLFEGVKESRLLIIADGPLHNVPFAALPLAQGADLLVDRFVLGYAPSLTLVIDDPPHPRRHGARIAVVSDPVYAADDRRLRVATTGSDGALRGPPPQSANHFTRLPYSALEANAVTRALASTDTIHLAGFDATSSKVLQLGTSDLAVLHFATHAVAQDNSPEQSALFLTEYAPDGSLLPSSRLTADEIRRSGLHADLVVLSGCATGDGKELRGEGVLGLTYGFLANGSRSVIASLWPIEDASTARFMSEFYKAYRVSGRAADALRVAQLRFRGAGGSPVWSSFVVRANEFP